MYSMCLHFYGEMNCLHARTHIFACLSRFRITEDPSFYLPCFFLGCSVGSLFENEWSLKQEYKRGGNRLELADRLASRILWIGIANLLLCPVILVWQILYAFFSYTEVSGSHVQINFKQFPVSFSALDKIFVVCSR